MGEYSSIRRCTRKLQLDYDTWYYIYQKLNSTIDQNSFGLTCVTFRDIQNLSRKSLKLRCSNSNTNSIIDSVTIDKLLNRHTQLEILTLGCRGCRHITYSCLTPLLKYGSTLHSLYLVWCEFITDTELTLIASACLLLSVISLRCAYEVSDHGLEILSKSCTSLKEVNLVDCNSITDNGIYFLNQNCRQLRALRVSGCYNIVGVGFRDCSPTLACLDAFNCNLDSTGVSQIVSGGGLEYLNISSPNRLIVLEPIGLGFCSKLKFLNIAYCSFVDDDVIVKISRGCPLLQDWNLTGAARTQAPTGTNYDVGSTTWADLRTAPLQSAIKFFCKFVEMGINMGMGMGMGMGMVSISHNLESELRYRAVQKCNRTNNPCCQHMKGKCVGL
ncbi:F-box/LRR-repeat protein 12-like [Rutidosis leptorrhynchoides]|uniref:F-box/LRR-repeat protein 12-like n=1 Tax=Rutidosis leptorrhynchoides TaxID=125765 RepID=UPI003A99A88C